MEDRNPIKSILLHYTTKSLFSHMSHCSSLLSRRFHVMSLLLSEGTSLSTRMKEILEKYSQHFTHLWEGFMGSKQTPRLEMLSRLKQCSAACSLFGLFTQDSGKQLRLLRCNTPDHFFTAYPFPNMHPACPRWSSCCARAVDSFTWGWSASWQTFHLPN